MKIAKIKLDWYETPRNQNRIDGRNLHEVINECPIIQISEYKDIKEEMKMIGYHEINFNKDGVHCEDDFAYVAVEKSEWDGYDGFRKNINTFLREEKLKRILSKT